MFKIKIFFFCFDFKVLLKKNLRVWNIEIFFFYKINNNNNFIKPFMIHFLVKIRSGWSLILSHIHKKDIIFYIKVIIIFIDHSFRSNLP